MVEQTFNNIVNTDSIQINTNKGKKQSYRFVTIATICNPTNKESQMDLNPYKLYKHGMVQNGSNKTKSLKRVNRILVNVFNIVLFSVGRSLKYIITL